jgi:hypothetical protein
MLQHPSAEDAFTVPLTGRVCALKFVFFSTEHVAGNKAVGTTGDKAVATDKKAVAAPGADAWSRVSWMMSSLVPVQP